MDCFSRYAYSRPLKAKQGPALVTALTEILDEAESSIDRKIKNIHVQVDQGKEFYNKHVWELLKARYMSIYLFSINSFTKSQIVERLIRDKNIEIPSRNTFKGKRCWIEIFQKLIIRLYQKIWLPHKSIWKMSVKFGFICTKMIFWHYKPKLILNVGQAVRISKPKKTFEKSYYQNYTDEIFFILPVTYRLIDSSE